MLNNHIRRVAALSTTPAISVGAMFIHHRSQGSPRTTTRNARRSNPLLPFRRTPPAPALRKNREGRGTQNPKRTRLVLAGPPEPRANRAGTSHLFLSLRGTTFLSRRNRHDTTFLLEHSDKRHENPFPSCQSARRRHATADDPYFISFMSFFSEAGMACAALPPTGIMAWA